jgi:hypothetical protein
MDKGFMGTLNQPAAPYDLSRTRVVDQYGIPVGCYGFCSRFLVKL